MSRVLSCDLADKSAGDSAGGLDVLVDDAGVAGGGRIRLCTLADRTAHDEQMRGTASRMGERQG